jgi:serine/threonine protein kinase
MGSVYQALDQKAGRSVALKILHPEVALDSVAVERFRREYKVSAALPHDHIVEVYSFEATEDDSYALVMEYLEGEELRAALKPEKTIPPARLVRILSQMAMALADAHGRSIVHRDLKPDNVFLCDSPDGDVVKLLDFGSVRDNSTGAKKLTMVGTTIGSPYYMSPEQAQGLESLDHRADVWSVAAIAYECLTGTLPFVGSTNAAILFAILSEDPALASEANPAVPRSVNPILEAGLTKSAGARTASIGLFVDQLGRALGLKGTHQVWAKAPLAELERQIAEGLSGAIAEHDVVSREGPRLSDIDAAFSEPKSTSLVPMGVPSGPPKWIVPVVVALLLGVVVAVAAFR